MQRPARDDLAARGTQATEVQVARATRKADQEGAGSGAASLAGYEYQIDVSVWLALDLVVVSQQTGELELEPASQEDLEARLGDAQPGRLVSRVPMNGYTLVVQAKRRGGDAWTPSSLRTLLEHGSDGRVSAADRLKDPDARYLLVTSAGVNGDASRLVRRHAGAWPKPAAMPAAISKAFEHDISGRVAVIANQDDERLRGDIDRLLTEGCRVPNARLDDCRRKLREDARARIARAGGGRWRREEIEEVVRAHDGYLASAPELDHYVHPTNWADLRSAMAERSAAIIVGTSGTGKTLATKMLFDELRREVAGLTRVPILFGPAQLHNDTTPRPVLYDIEDPWGRFDFDPASRPWNDQLAGFLAAARPDAMIVATSRHDVALASGALGSVQPWTIGLEAENYGPGERRRLYRTRLASLPRDLQPLARGAEDTVLGELATPLEIQKFFDAMRTQDREGLKNPPGFVRAAIAGAHQNSIEQTVIDQIEKRGDVRAAAVLHALLLAAGKLTRPVLREVEDGLADRDVDLGRGLSPLVDFFVAARNLRQGDGGIVSYYHPRVEAGITRALGKDEHRQAVRRILRQLLDLLVSDEGPGPEWGAGAAARILANVRERLGVSPSPAAAGRIDAWLDARLANGGKGLEADIELAARAGSAGSNGAEIARFLRNRPDRSFAGFNHWAPPERPEAWYAARAADPATRPLLERFVREVLPRDRTDYPGDLGRELARLSDGLTPAFVDAAAEAVHFGYIPTDEAIARGGLVDLDGFEGIVDTAVEVLTPSERERASAAETRLDIVNDVYSEDYAQHLAESDDGYTAGEFLKCYIERVRADRGWRSVAQHRHAEMLRTYWLRALAATEPASAVDPDELAGAFQAGYGTSDEDEVWSVLAHAWDDRYRAGLEVRVRDGSPHADVNRAALACLAAHAPDAVRPLLERLSGEGRADRMVSIARDLAHLRRGRTRAGRGGASAAETAAANLPRALAAIGNAQFAMLRGRTPRPSREALTLLARIREPSPQTRAFRLALDAHAALPVEDDVRWALANSDEPKVAVDAIEAAIRRGMAVEVDAALDHRFAHVAARALAAVAGPLPAPLPQRLLDLARHRASPVRSALADALRAKPHPDHVATLLVLADDRWSRHSDGFGGDADHPIAQTAVAALAEIAPLGAEANAALLGIATDTSDHDVRVPIFDLLARTGGAEMQRRIFALATEPGRARVRSAAAHALLRSGPVVDQSVVDLITPRLLATRYEPVGAVLATLLGWRGSLEAIRASAEHLATNQKRRALLLLIAWTLADRDRGVAEEVAAMLPPGHPGAAWALGAPTGPVDEEAISDLGDPLICAEVATYMRLGAEPATARTKRKAGRSMKKAATGRPAA